jgi:hypothetical protein
MLEIIILYFLAKKIGATAIQKGLNPTRWKIYTVVAWLVGEIGGAVIGFSIFGKDDLMPLLFMALFGAFGGYLLVKYNLEKMPDDLTDDINRIDVNDLGPKR